MDLTSILVFYDGMDIAKYSKNQFVSGFTTNCSVFSKWSEKNYQQYYNSVKDFISNKSISFQIWEDDIVLAKQQIDSIYLINPNIYVKIPIINTKGEFNNELFQYAMSKNMNINITCLYTLEQINHAFTLFSKYTLPIIISVFAGPISDTGVDPSPFVKLAVNLFKENQSAKILWAGCREVYSIQRAITLGCHIITAPDTVIDKLASLGKDLTIASIERIKIFRTDALNSHLSI